MEFIININEEIVIWGLRTTKNSALLDSIDQLVFNNYFMVIIT